MKRDNGTVSNIKIVSELMLRLLPAQVLLVAVGSVNGIVSSLFASNFLGPEAMSAVGLCSPLNMLMVSVSTVIMGGSVIICGQYMGKDMEERLQDVFSADLTWALIFAAGFTALFVPASLFDLTGFLTRDASIRPLLNSYMLGQAVGIVPLLAGNTFAAFLSMENRTRRTYAASILYIVSNAVLNFLFVVRLKAGIFGLALASSLGGWIFLAFNASAFLSRNSRLRIRAGSIRGDVSGDIFRIGLPGAASNVYQTARGLIVNRLIEAFVGSMGISAFAASDTVMRVFWAIPGGMLAVSRLMMSVSAGDEDRQTLTDVMRVMFRRYLPLMCAVSAGIILCAEPFSSIFYRDPSSAVHIMTVWGYRILPLCMPLSVIYMPFSCFYQLTDRSFLVHLLALLDGVVSVVVFSAVLIPSMGMNSVYVSNVLNGVVTTIVIAAFAWIRAGHIPKNMEELMVIPRELGAPEDMRLDLSVDSMEEVLTIAETLQAFCLSKGIDEKRSYIAALCTEEMAGNIVSHGFTKDGRRHSIDVRAVVKDEEVILRIRDDCVPFDPYERSRLTEGDDILKNIGIRMVFACARDVQYKNILGLNALTIRI